MSYVAGLKEDRFEAFVERVPFLECWVWMGYLDKHGYGSFHWEGRSITKPAYQAAWWLYKGKPRGVLRHTCDNPWCVNPSHLLEGTQLDNIQDMLDRNRQARGERAGSSVLTEEEVRAIRNLSAQGVSGKALAKQYGVNASCICKIVKGYSWKHLL